MGEGGRGTEFRTAKGRRCGGGPLSAAPAPAMVTAGRRRRVSRSGWAAAMGRAPACAPLGGPDDEPDREEGRSAAPGEMGAGGDAGLLVRRGPAPRPRPSADPRARVRVRRDRRRIARSALRRTSTHDGAARVGTGGGDGACVRDAPCHGCRAGPGRAGRGPLFARSAPPAVRRSVDPPHAWARAVLGPPPREARAPDARRPAEGAMCVRRASLKRTARAVLGPPPAFTRV